MPSLLCRCKSFQSESSLLNWPSSDLTALWVQWSVWKVSINAEIVTDNVHYDVRTVHCESWHSTLPSLTVSVSWAHNEWKVCMITTLHPHCYCRSGEPLTGHLTNNLELSVILSIQAVRKILSKPFPSGGNSTVNSNLSNFWWPGPTLTQTASQQAGKVDNPNLSGPQSFLLTPVSKFVNCLFVNKNHKL